MKFNLPYLTGKEVEYMQQAVHSRHTSGDGEFTKKCQNWFEKKFGFKKVFLTTSCTDALEIAALLIDIKEGDEVIVPSFTFVSTANAFLLRGAKIVFADSENDTPNIDAKQIEKLITPKTKAILVMHYAGLPCNMPEIKKIADSNHLFLIEDAALALGSYVDGKLLGSFGHLSAFSFHETKNISCGEGGMIVINDERFLKRAEIIREKGTNRSAFFRGEIDKYGWTDIGSSYLPSDILAAYLWAQLEQYDFIQQTRKDIWNRYFEALLPLQTQGKVRITPKVEHANASIFYLVCESLEQRTELINYAKQNGVPLTFHYQALHSSAFAKSTAIAPNAERYSDTLIRLPLYPDLSNIEIDAVINCILAFYI